MIYSDIAAAVRWMEERWGHDKAWDHWEAFASDFTPYTHGALKETLHRLFKSGRRFAPKPSELLKELGVVQGQRIDRGEDEIERDCGGDHRWAEPSPFDDDRHQTCILCGAVGALVACEHPVRSRNGICVYCPDRIRPPVPEPAA